MKQLQHDYILRTYAGWLGKTIGVRLGSNIENWSFEAIREKYGILTDYVDVFEDYAADDDLNGPMFLVRALEDYKEGHDLSYEALSKTWLNYVKEGSGFFWWGGYSFSTEHTAYMNLKAGMDAPYSGSIEANGLACAEQIGGQIFSDCWGFVAPNQPALAADLAMKAARVSHDGEGVYGAAFVAAAISLAYGGGTIREVIEKALTYIPETSMYYKVCHEVIAFYDADTSKDWEACYRYIEANHWKDKYFGVHIIPNSALMILSMLYGEGDYSKTICMINMCGFDTDCNAGNVGAIMGVLVGIEGIEAKWITPIGDLMIGSSAVGSMNINTLSHNVHLFTRLGYALAEADVPEVWQETIFEKGAKYTFDYPYGIQAFRLDTGVEGSLVTTQAACYKGLRGLEVTLPYLDKETRIYHKTYYQVEDVPDDRYQPTFSPIAYPGQTLSVWIKLAKPQSMQATLMYRTFFGDEYYTSEPVTLDGTWQQLTFQIGSHDGEIIREVGITLSGKCDEEVKVYIDQFDITGTPTFNYQFESRLLKFIPVSNRFVLHGFNADPGWKVIDGKLEGRALTPTRLYGGDCTWRDYRLTATLQPVKGVGHQIHVRSQGAARSYILELGENQTLKLLKQDREMYCLASIPYSWTYGTTYAFTVEVRDNNLCVYEDNTELIAYQDTDKPYLNGGIALGLSESAACYYHALGIESIK